MVASAFAGSALRDTLVWQTGGCDKFSSQAHSQRPQRRSPRRATCRASRRDLAEERSAHDRRNIFLKYVQTVNPEFMEEFAEHAPPQVVDAMRKTLTNMMGTLPPQFFDVKITTSGETMAQLMFSVMMSGYMFRNAQYRLELQQAMDRQKAPVVERPEPILARSWDEGDYAAGVQTTRVRGEVLRWRHDSGPEAIPAVDYIQSLEEENRLLRQLAAARLYAAGGLGAGLEANELLTFLKSLPPHTLSELTACDEVILEATNSFVHRLLGTKDQKELQRSASENDACELARLLYWLMVVGYNLRTLEVRFDMEQSMLLPSQ